MHEDEFPKFFPKIPKIPLGPRGRNSRFGPKPDYPFPHEFKPMIGIEIGPQIGVQKLKI